VVLIVRLRSRSSNGGLGFDFASYESSPAASGFAGAGSDIQTTHRDDAADDRLSSIEDLH
jgi:hypothetical protein